MIAEVIACLFGVVGHSYILDAAEGLVLVYNELGGFEGVAEHVEDVGTSQIKFKIKIIEYGLSLFVQIMVYQTYNQFLSILFVFQILNVTFLTNFDEIWRRIACSSKNNPKFI